MLMKMINYILDCYKTSHGFVFKLLGVHWFCFRKNHFLESLHHSYPNMVLLDPCFVLSYFFLLHFVINSDICRIEFLMQGNIKQCHWQLWLAGIVQDDAFMAMPFLLQEMLKHWLQSAWVPWWDDWWWLKVIGWKWYQQGVLVSRLLVFGFLWL